MIIYTYRNDIGPVRIGTALVAGVLFRHSVTVKFFYKSTNNEKSINHYGSMVLSI